MEKKNQLLEMVVSGRDTISLVGVVIGVVIFSFNYFETKSDADLVEKRQTARIEVVERKMDKVTEKLSSVSEDTQYIRGRLEPRNK